MNYLLDTHAFIWWDSEPEKLSANVLKVCQNSGNKLFLSVASIWEMQIKSQLGKLSFDVALNELLDEQVHSNNILLLPVKPIHIYGLSTLPNIHKDPFDRLLISQAREEALILLSIDPKFEDYPVDVHW